MIAAPGLIPRQIRSRQVVSLIDTAPGALDLVGAPPSGRHQGRSFLDPSSAACILFLPTHSDCWASAMAPELIYELDSNHARLFDLTSDPGETGDLSAQEPAQTRWYVENLRGWSAAQRVLLRAAR